MRSLTSLQISFSHVIVIMHYNTNWKFVNNKYFCNTINVGNYMHKDPWTVQNREHTKNNTNRDLRIPYSRMIVAVWFFRFTNLNGIWFRIYFINSLTLFVQFLNSCLIDGCLLFLIFLPWRKHFRIIVWSISTKHGNEG